MEQKKNCPKCGNEFLPTRETDNVCPKCLAQFVMEPSEISNQKQSAINNEPILPSGTKIGPYEIKEMLGRGGMGTVYKAYQPMLDRFVAIKILPTKLSTDPEFITRFNREAKALAGLSHPNIVAIYDIGQAGGYFYFVMEFVEGVTTRQLIEAHTLPPEEALKIVPQLCDALEYAHSEGVVHRDIKPENILMDKKGRVKIADFGLARIVRGDIVIDPVTRTQEVMGTFDYMAPEQRMKSKDVDHRADIYSLGVVFYEMLTGELPIGRFELPSHKVQIDVRVDDIVMKTLEREPQKRYQRASEVGTAVSQILSEGISIKQQKGEKKAVITMSFDLRAILSAIASLILGFVPDGIANIIAIVLGFFTRVEVKKGYGHKRLLILANIGIMAGIGSLILEIIELWNTDPQNFTEKLLFGGFGYILIALCLIYILRLIFIGNKATTSDLSKSGMQSASKYSTNSIMSIVFAFIPLCITQILGIIFGILAIRKINRSAGQLKGMGLAIAGIVISIIVGLTVVPIILAIAIPNFIRGKSMMTAQENEKEAEQVEINKRMEDKKQQLAQSLEVANNIKDEQTKAHTLYQISVQYAEIGEYAKAIEITKPIAGTGYWKGEALNKITLIYVQSGQKSTEILSQALEVAKTIPEMGGKSHTIHEISVRYAEIGEYEKAIETIKLIENEYWKDEALQKINKIKVENK